MIGSTNISLEANNTRETNFGDFMTDAMLNWVKSQKKNPPSKISGNIPNSNFNLVHRKDAERQYCGI